MLLVKFVGEEDSLCLHVGSQKDTLFFAGREVEWLQADGHELGTIMLQVKNIPTSIHPVVKWRGAFAQFIFDALDLDYARMTVLSSEKKRGFYV
jgi:hypothetical protein